LKDCSTIGYSATSPQEGNDMSDTTAGSTSRPVLVTGFGPFGNHTRNPSADLARSLDGEVINGARVTARIFATSTETVADELAAALTELNPSAVLSLGLAPGRPALSLERIAINVRDFPVPDYSGVQLTDAPIDPSGPDGRFSGLPIKAILGEWQRAAIPGHISDTAGTYLCNQLFYLVAAAGEQRGIPAGFIHIPDTPESAAVSAGNQPVGQPTMELATMRRGLLAAIALTVAPETARPAAAVTAGAIA
jgi:pyroglutamyl-peptidase